MGGKLCPKIILEGTRLTFKTDVAFTLNEHPRIVGPRRYRYHSPLISAEWCTFTNWPWGRGLINYEPEEEERAMETYEAWMRLLELQKYYSWIIDRFHISTQAFQHQARGAAPDFLWLEKRLKAVGFVIVFLNRSPDSFEAARRERLKVSGKPDQYDDLKMFIGEQGLMRDLVSKSCLPVMDLDISDNDVVAAVEKIADWMEKNEYLYAQY